MDIALAVFAYNRPIHLQKILGALKNNIRLQNVYIFQDGLAAEDDMENWTKVQNVIQSIDWMEYAYITYPQNKGCAFSIEDGISHVLSEHEAVIVLEDDCVPHENFISFAVGCLEKYREDKRVWGISGYAWPMALSQENASDVYACGRTCSYGWATWEDRWRYYSRDCDILKRIYLDQEASRRLGVWGSDLDEMLCATVKCQCDAWDVFWGLHAIEQGGFFINPYKNLIQNIGFDGSGLQSGEEARWMVDLWEGSCQEFLLPDKITISVQEELAFAELHNGYGHQAAYRNQDARKAVVWGIGANYQKNKRELLKKYDVQAFIDKKKIRYFEGKPVISCKSLCQYDYEYVLIMFNNTEEAERMKDKLVREYGIDSDRIKIGLKDAEI